QASSALESLEKLRNTYPESGRSSHINARIAGNIGGCALELGDVGRAIIEFRKAHRIQPTLVHFIALGALANLLANDFEQTEAVAREGLEKNPGHADLAALLIQSLFALNRMPEIEELQRTQLWMLDEPVCCLAFADGFQRINQLAKA